MPSSLETNNQVADSERRKQLLLKKKRKRDFDYLTSGVLMEHQKHLLASLHFKAIYNRLLFVPSIAITLVSGILAVIAQSGLYSERTQAVCTIWIAILAAFSVFWQSLMKQLDYGGGASLHDSAASSLSKIFKLAGMRSREQQMSDYENSNKPQISEKTHDRPSDLEHIEEGRSPPDGVTSQDGNDSTSTEEAGNVVPAESAEMQQSTGAEHFTLSKQFEQALQGCTSIVPIKITAAFNALDSRINVCNKKLVPSPCAKPKISWEEVFPALYYQLTLTIIGSRMWPYVVPDPEWAVDKTVRDFQGVDACLLKTLVSRAQEIDDEYGNLATESTPLMSTRRVHTVE